jgi:hypothetical protein
MIRARWQSALGITSVVGVIANRWTLIPITAAVIIVVVLVFGVVLPAVWSSDPARRRDALAVIKTLWPGRRK